MIFIKDNICKENNIENVYIDVMLDGRDTYEKSAIKYLDILQKKLDFFKKFVHF